MIKKNQSKLNFLNIFLDFVLILASIFISIALRFWVFGGIISIHFNSPVFILGSVIFSVLMVVLYYMFGIYKSFRLQRIGRENLKIVLLNAVGTLIFAAVLFVVRIVDMSRWALVIFWFVSSILVIFKQILVRVIVRYYRRKGYNLKHFVIIGNGRMAYKFIKNIHAHPELGIEIDGYISASEKADLGKCLGKYEDLEQILEGNNYDALVIALEPHEYVWMLKVLSIAAKEGTPVEMIPFYNDEFPSNPTIEIVGDTKLINMRATPLDNLGWAMMKRTCDIVISFILIIVTSPIMLATAIGVKLSSPGPVFFKQVRVGKYQKPFTMLKFRSMRTDVDHEGWTTDVDNRRTKFGSFIRKFSIDELPQFFNVLVGQMSLVGPRPELPVFVAQFKDNIPRYLIRQQLRPGITGWAQVNGLRGDTSIEKRLEYDIDYIENWSFSWDIVILFKTLFGGFVNEEKVS